MIFSYLQNMQSHPSWVCGLKQNKLNCLIMKAKSHPSWVCGLKPILLGGKDRNEGHTLRGCVD